MEAAQLFGAGVIPTGAIVPVRGGRVLSLRHRGLAGVEPGHYRDSVSDGECLLYADMADVVGGTRWVWSARPAQRCFPLGVASRRPSKAGRPQRVIPGVLCHAGSVVQPIPSRAPHFKPGKLSARETPEGEELGQRGGGLPAYCHQHNGVDRSEKEGATWRE